MKTLRLCLAALSAVTFLLGQTPPRDVDGWGKIRWGMTLADAGQAYVIDRHDDNDRWSQIIAQPVLVGDITMRVSIGAKHGSEQVSRVRLSTNSGAEDFETLKAQLIQKYGPPIDGETRTEGTDTVRTFLWTFPSTSIRLTLTQSRIEVDYSATDRNALDAL
jgi:hypothetical protein